MADSHRPSYRLDCVPWIGVLYADGTTGELSLRDALARAAEIAGLVCDMPQQELPIVRVCLAVLYRALGEPGMGEDAALDLWEGMWRRGSFDMDAVDAYLERWGERFDLFDGERPFFQVAGLEYVAGHCDGMVELVADCPKPERWNFCLRSPKGASSLTVAEAARWLVFLQAYAVAGIKTPVVGNSRVNAGKVYARKGVLGTGWLGALGGTFLRGGTLFETLMLNLVLFDGERSGQGCLLQAPHDLPSWERPLPENPADDADPFSEDNFRVGPASLMTWQSRRVRLVPDEAGERVVGLICCYGDFPQVADLQYAETMTAWRLSPAQQKKLGCDHVPWMPALHDAARALWRGLAPLLSASKTADGEVDLRPGVVRWVERLLEAGAPLPERVGICAQSMSYGTQSAVYTDAYDDTVEVPVSALVRGSQAASIALGTVAMAEEGVSALSFLAKTLHEASGDRSAGARLSAALSDVQTEAYGELDGLFRDRLARLPESDPDGGFREGWAADARAALLEIGERLVVDSAAPLFKVRQKVVGGKSVDVAAGRSFSYYVHKVDEAFGAASAGEGE